MNMADRVIKFRAWDEHRKIMIYKFDEKRWSKKSYRLIFSEENEIHCGNYMDNGDWQEPKLMMFTGLKDKNGVEIYEGDILFHEIDDCKQIVVYNYKTAAFKRAMTDHVLALDFGVHTFKYVEVIGNIYSNYELLKFGN